MNQNCRSSPSLVRYVADMAAYDSARSLDLLKAIESTVQTNEALCETFQQTTHQVTRIIKAIYARQGEPDGEIIDTDGEIRNAFEEAMKHLGLICAGLKQHRAHAKQNPGLRDDDGVIESFDRVIEAITEAHDILNEVSWAVMEHDADASPRSGKGPFKSAKDLIASLG